jgi:hypothetical protein
MQSREQVDQKLNNCNFKTIMMPNIGYKTKPELQGVKTVLQTGVLSPAATLRQAYTDQLNIQVYVSGVCTLKYNHIFS